MLNKLSISFAAFLGLLMLAGFMTPAYGEPNLLLFDGEDTYTCVYGQPDQTQPFRGRSCFMGTPDQYHKPRITLPAKSFRANISMYDEIWMYIKCDQAGKTAALSAVTYYGTSNEVVINNYIDGKVLDNTYRLARIPLSALKTATYTLDKVDHFYFGVAAVPVTGHKLYIDEIWAVDLDNANPAQTPLLDVLPPVNFGDVALGNSAQKSFPLKNTGGAALTISGYTVSGTNDYSCVSGPSTLQPGQSGTVTVTYTPSTPGACSGDLNIAHNATALGVVTKVALGGSGVGPAIGVSNVALDFGSVQVGSWTAWPVIITNKGNQPLVVSSVSGSVPLFSGEPGTMTLAPGASAEIRAKFSATATGAASGTLTIASNDPLMPAFNIDLTGTGIAAGGTAALNAMVSSIKSTGVTVVWPFVSGAESYRVYLGPEPATTPGGALQNGMLWATTSPTLNNCDIEPLAAAVDVFMRVEAYGGGRVMAAANLHAKTVGGPRAVLGANNVREVHMMSPRVMQVVLSNAEVQSYSGATGALGNYKGPEWQSGAWTVTKSDGTAIPVTNVYRNSVPVGQPYYELGAQNLNRTDKVDVDHRIFLVLQEAVQSGSVVKVDGPTGTFYLPFSDKYLETPAIQVNQVGYSPRATERWAYVSGYMGDGGALPLSDFPATAEMIVDPADPMTARATAVKNLAISIRSDSDTDAGGPVKQIDLASVPAAEDTVYRVRIPGVGVSWPTQVSETAVFKSFYVAIRGLYHNRWGRELSPQYTEWCERPVDHPTVYTGELYDTNGNPVFGYGPEAMYPKETPKVGERTLRGGHHNAGDFDIQLSDHVISMMLLRLFELNGDAFLDGQLTIPESGNGIPDVLDEALWNLAAWEQLQEADGGVRGGAESYVEPSGREFADQDTLPYWTYSRHPLFSVNMAGIFAQASRILEPINPAKAAEFRDRAVRAYDYGFSHGVDHTFRGPVLYGTGELFRLTGQQSYLDKFTAAWNTENGGGGPGIVALMPAWTCFKMDGDQVVIGDNLIGYAKAAGAVPTHLTRINNVVTQAAEEAVRDIANLHAHRNGRYCGPGWGYGTAVGEFTQRIMYRMQLGGITDNDRQRYFNALSLSADYVLGCNPEGRAWITGLGSRHPEEPLHSDSLCFAKTPGAPHDPVPGLAVFGPTTNISEKNYYDYGEYTFYPKIEQHPLMHRYADIRTFVLQSEIGSAQIAIHAELLGALVSQGMMPAESWLPYHPEHRNTLAPRAGIHPATGDDHTPPTLGTLTAPEATSTKPITIDYSGMTDAGSGIKRVTLWVKKETTGTWQNSGLSSNAIAGMFAYQPSDDGQYFFSVQAQDNAGNATVVPSGAGMASTMLDTTPPNPGTLSSPPATKSTPITVTYSGVKDSGTGPKEVRLWVKKGPTGAWTDTGMKSTTPSGTFSYNAVDAEQPYYFYLQAVDNAGCKNPDPTDELVGLNK